MRASHIDLQSHWQQLVLLLMLAFSLAWWSGLKDITKDLLDTAEDSTPSSLPNILMIVVDDLGYNDISAINRTGIPTPNIDRIAAEGSLFTRHYADATCSPSRVAILTGRHPERSGFRHRGIEIPAEFPTIAQSLKTVGYVTFLAGKWHAGEERSAGWPTHKGFDESFGFLNQWQLAGDDSRKKTPTYYNPWLRSNDGSMRQYKGHLTDILTKQSVKKIKALKKIGQPWFIYHAYLAPHDPIEPAQRYRDKFPATAEGEYLALIKQLDDSVGELLAAVDGDQNTLVIFVSDNGGTNLRRDNNFPFYGKKNEVYEGSYRTPLAMRWPGVIPRQIVDDTVMNVDIMPTIIAAIGASVPQGIDGRNLWPRITQGVSLATMPRSWEQFNWNVETMTFSLLSADNDWRLSGMYGLDPMLYQLSQDPSGANNVAASNPRVVESMLSQYWQQHWEKSVLAVTARSVDDLGITEYSGFDVMRTPYLYGFSIGLEIGPLAVEGEPNSPSVLASQQGVWELKYLPGMGAEWHIGDKVLVDSSFDPGKCNRLILTGDLQPGEEVLSETASQQVVKLYSGGFLQEQKKSLNYSLPRDDVVSRPTRVFYGGKAIFSSMALSSYSDLYQPDISSEHYDLFSDYHKQAKLGISRINAMDKLLCNGSAIANMTAR
jgi:arylsulfatase A-like enzyme